MNPDISQNGHHADTTWADSAQEWSAQASDALADVRSRLDGVDKQIRTFVNEKPLAAVGMALAAGFLVGRLLK